MLGFVNKTHGFIAFVMRYRILLMIIGFFVYLFFFDEYKLKTRFKVAATTNKLIEQKQNYLHLIGEAKQDKLDLEQNYEKFAREKFIMSRPDEDVFIIDGRQIKQ